MRMKRRFSQAIAIVATSLFGAAVVFAQQTSPSPASRSNPEVATPAQILATGWQPVTFKAADVSPEEAEKGKRWLAGGSD